MRFTERVSFYRIRKKVKEQYSGLKVLESIITEAIFFSIWVFFHEHSGFTRQQGKVSLSISSTAFYHFHLLHRHLDISRAVTAERSPMHISSSWTWTRNIFFSKCKLLTTKLCGKQLLVSVFKFWFHLTTQFTLKI